MGDPASPDRLTTAYQDAWSGRVVLPRPAPDAIELSGSTRLDFLQRMSTNDFSHLEPGSFLWTVLTTPLARVVDWVQVLARADDLLLLTSPGRGTAVLEWLRRYVFFRDDLVLHLEPAPRQVWLALGPSAAAIAAAVAPHTQALASDAWLQSGEALTWRVDRPGAGGWAILCPPAGLPVLVDSALPQPTADNLYEILRIEAGLPSPGSEITDERIPLEVGLSTSISLDKGCYVGQEIIARMTSLHRLARRLVGVQLTAPADPGVELRQEDNRVGHLTSIACSPRLGWIGLGLVRPTALQAQPPTVAVGPSADPAVLVDLPFPPASA